MQSIMIIFIISFSLLQIILKNSCAMQVDGEPWHQSPCIFNITHVNQAVVLMNNDYE